MASASGTPVPAIARLVVADEDTVRVMIHRCNETGLDCLVSMDGRPPRLISSDDEAFLLATTRLRSAEAFALSCTRQMSDIPHPGPQSGETLACLRQALGDHHPATRRTANRLRKLGECN